MAEAEVVSGVPVTARPVVDTTDLVPQLAMTPAQFLKHLDELREVVKEVMVEGVDYGPAFPGSTKLSLLKAGGEKLAELYGYRIEPRVVNRVEIWSLAIPASMIPTNDVAGSFLILPERGPFFHFEFEATAFSKRTGNFVGKGVGSCNSRETKYRWRQGERACPDCSLIGALRRSRRQYGGGWYCAAAKGGCGSSFKADTDKAKQIDAQDVDRVENEDIADVHNTVLKIGKKRAYLDVVISVTQSAGIFEAGEDDDDDEGAGSGERRGPQQKKGGNGNPPPAGRTKVMVAGQEHYTLGCTSSQLMRIWSMEKEFDKAHGKDAHKAALKQLCGVETSVDLTEALADKVIKEGLPAPVKGTETTSAAAATTGEQQELGGAKAKDADPYA